MYAAPKTASGPALGPGAVVARALVAGAACGLASGALAGIPYLLAHVGQFEVDWSRLAVAFTLFSIATGASIGVGTASGMLIADRVGSRLAGAASALIGATLGGALVGTMPGAFGTAYFGRQHTPFVGTAAIAVLPFAGVLALSALVADIDRRAAGDRPRLLPHLIDAFLMTIPFAAAGGALVVFVGDDGVLRMVQRYNMDRWVRGDDVAWSLALLGSSFGAVLGAALGAHVGGTAALARVRSARSRRRESDAKT
jgi:hypothetical protein